MNKKIGNKTTNKRNYFGNKNFIFFGLAILIVVLVIVFLVIQFSNTKNVKAGDVVKVDYTGYTEDEKIFDTSIKEIGEKNSLDKKEYKPFEFKVGSGQVIPGFDKGVLGMKVGETKKIELSPKDAYGIRKEELVIKDNKRELKIKKVLEINIGAFKRAVNKEPVLNDVVQTETLPWKVKIIKIQNDKVFVENLLTKGENVVLPGTSWDSKITDLKNGEFIIMQNPKVGDSVAFPTQQGFIAGGVTNVDEIYYEIDSNPPLAGKRLIFDVTLLSINPN